MDGKSTNLSVNINIKYNTPIPNLTKIFQKGSDLSEALNDILKEVDPLSGSVGNFVLANDF